MAKKSAVNKLSQHGVDEVPTNWHISKVKYLGYYINGYPFKPTDWSLTGRPILRIQNLTSPEGEPNRYDDEIPSRYLVRKGDLLISWSASLGIFRWEGEEAWLNQHIFKVIVNEEKLDSGYFFWLADWFIREMAREVHGSTMQHLTADAFGGFPVLIPPSTVQKQLTKYLDSEISRIDGLVAKKDELISLLFEKRQALIYNAIFGRGKSQTTVKDTFVEWIGQIPTHWKVERSKWLFSERNERSETGQEDMMTVSHLTGVTLRSEKEVNMFEAETNEGYKICEEGDLVINTLWGWMGAMGTSPQKGIVSPAYHVYKPISDLYPGYIDAIVRLPVFAKEVTKYSKGVWSSRLRLYPDGFYEVYFPVPPYNEQLEIVDHIKTQTKQIDALSNAAQRSIVLLKERRAELITSIVTGKFKPQSNDH